eukprot:6443946-Ditylum_brightwellii.AAC.2
MPPMKNKQNNRGTYLQFTTEVWQPPAQKEEPTSNMREKEDINLRNADMAAGNTKIVQSEEFLFLDMATA